jgi:hypothetical protein
MVMGTVMVVFLRDDDALLFPPMASDRDPDPGINQLEATGSNARIAELAAVA